MMSSNLIDFSKFMPDKQAGIDIEAAKKYFVNEVLPYVCEDALQRLIQADLAGDPHQVHVEMMRMFIESELMRTNKSDTSSLRSFFLRLNKDQLAVKVPKQ